MTISRRIPRLHSRAGDLKRKIYTLKHCHFGVGASTLIGRNAEGVAMIVDVDWSDGQVRLAVSLVARFLSMPPVRHSER
jgi:hypothetical protein